MIIWIYSSFSFLKLWIVKIVLCVGDSGVALYCVV